MNTIMMMQSSLITILQNGFLFSYLLVMQFAFAALIAWLLSDARLDRETLSILSFLGGILGFTLFSLCMVVMKIKPSPSLGMAAGILAFLIIIRLRRHLYPPAAISLTGIVLFFLVILLLRLIFIQNLIVPPYADSILHLQIVQDFLNPNRQPEAFYQLSPDLTRYYHFGFHATAAWLSGVTSTSPEQTILLLGQYFQTLAILALYPLARLLTGDKLSAWAAMIIAGLILSIPAYISNWGKYPAIASMTGISFCISLFLIYAKKQPMPSKKILWLTSLGVLATTCLHSRSFLVLLLSILAIAFYDKTLMVFDKLEVNDNDVENKTLAIMPWTILLHILILALKFPGSSNLYFFQYLFWLLTILAFYSDFILTWTLSTFLLVMGINLLLPLPASILPIRFTLLFDRPFLIVFFYLPASLLIWQGLDGSLRFLNKNKHFLWRPWLLLIVLIFGVGNAFIFQNHRPSNCCIFLDDDDLFSFHWMKENIPKGAIVGIAATGNEGNFLPADGGAWIENFTDIPTRKLDTKEDFIYKTWKLCLDHVTYFYIDGLENSFDEYNLKESGAIYQFGLGNVRIYHLDCDYLY